MLDGLSDDIINQRVCIKLMLLTGIRNAELHGLRWSDVDLENHILHVRRNRLVSKQFGEYEKSPKTKTSLLRILFNKAVRYEWIAKNPVCKTKVGASAKNGNISIKPVEEKEVFSLAEVRYIYKHIAIYEGMQRISPFAQRFFVWIIYA